MTSRADRESERVDHRVRYVTVHKACPANVRALLLDVCAGFDIVQYGPTYTILQPDTEAGEEVAAA